MNSLLDGTPTVPENYFNELVGEGRKFTDQEALARGKYESDMYIQTLTRQLDELRGDYLREKEGNVSRAKLQELIDKMGQTPSNNQPNVTQPEVKPPFAEEQIKSLVSNTVQEIEHNKKRDANFNLVLSKLTERHGPNYQNVLEQQIKALDLTLDQANELARSNPQLFIKSFNLDEPRYQQGFQTPPRPGVNTSNFKPVQEKRDWEYYQKMKMEDPKRYHSPQTNVQMVKDRMELGEAFETGDYNKADRELIGELGYRAEAPSPMQGYNPFKERDRRR